MIKDICIDGIKLCEYPKGTVAKIAEKSLEVNAEGMVLLKNDGMLPLNKNDRTAVFGRTQFKHYISGTGSGGKVNVQYSTNLYDSMKELGINVDTELADEYLNWLEENPYDKGDGWIEPCAQSEMPISEEKARSIAERAKKAVVIIGRTAGEDSDNKNEKGSYLLTDAEYEMLKNVSEAFDDVCVLLNTGNIIDMKWADELNISAIMYIWHGGQVGGHAAAETLCGERYPSGHLSDTIPYNIEDFPSYDSFDNDDEQIYSEDIFVGYRYFETFCPQKVMYPFGFGLSYSKFKTNISEVKIDDEYVQIYVKVKNNGDYKGKEVVQVYFGVEDTVLSHPKKSLLAFKKTKELLPQEECEIDLKIKISDMVVYDDIGKSGYKSAYILEKGTYRIYLGSDVRNAQEIFSFFKEKTVIVKQLSEVLPLQKPIERMINDNGTVKYERISSDKGCVQAIKAKAIPYSGDKGIKLRDVYNKTATLQDFVAQLNDFELACLSQGEGMNSPKVRPGTGGAIGGVTSELRKFGIPAVCVTDGPSGLRFDNGDKATSMPNGTVLACTWNEDITEQLYIYEGVEAYVNNVDALLGPGLNIHRIPLCGRNFEYMSEDPYLTGHIAAAVCRGLKKAGITATIKHFSANNKEKNRKQIDMIISERALREIYLKPFEIAVHNADVEMVMTAYNMINGVFCSSNYDLNTVVLREEWGYAGLVMTDWWPNTQKLKTGEFNPERCFPVFAQNDVFMVNESSKEMVKKYFENKYEELDIRGSFQRNAMNILRVIMTTPTFENTLFNDIEDIEENEDVKDLSLCFSYNGAKNEEEILIYEDFDGKYMCVIEFSADCSDLMQFPINIYVNGESEGVCMIRGTQNKIQSKIVPVNLKAGKKSIVLKFADENIKIHSVKLYK